MFLGFMHGLAENVAVNEDEKKIKPGIKKADVLISGIQ